MSPACPWKVNSSTSPGEETVPQTVSSMEMPVSETHGTDTTTVSEADSPSELDAVSRIECVVSSVRDTERESPVPSCPSTSLSQTSASPPSSPSSGSWALPSRVMLSPLRVTVSSAGRSMVADSAASSTTSVAESVCCRAAARIEAAPSPRPRANPDESTVATEVSSDAQATAVPPTGWPFASAGVARNRWESAGVASRAESGSTSTRSTACSTTSSAESDSPEASTRTVAVPFDSAVTVPSSSTDATLSGAIDQEKSTSDIVSPSWSLAVALNSCEASRALSCAEDGLSSTLATRDSGAESVPVGGSPSSEHAARRTGRRTASATAGGGSFTFTGDSSLNGGGLLTDCCSGRPTIPCPPKAVLVA